ncbi:MAG: class I SAM-dependent methyltransferase [Oscillospiraceae bacterium]|nr:class I SAM-dependent methyltransferase [Oscillospiraceae bacterium]
MKRPISLSPRLMAVADWIREADRVADVGTDHARLPVFLTQRGLARSVIGLDISSGPLARAGRLLKVHGLEGQVTLMLSDGLLALTPEQIDTAVITGLGGETILSIAQASPWLKEKRLIAGPHTRHKRMVNGFDKMGFCLNEFKLVFDGGRMYHLYLFDRQEKK